MADLAASPAGEGLFPIEVGGLRAQALALGPLWLVMPYRGQAGAVARMLACGWPEPGRIAEGGGARAIWAGREAALVEGARPDGLCARAALVEQSDAWCATRLDGRGVEEALARLVPIDLRARAFPEGSAARTLLGHMPGLVLRRGGAIEAWAPRSMAGTLAHELARAMRGAAGREVGAREVGGRGG